MTSTVEIQKDVEELQKLVGEASRSRVKDLLNLEIRRLQTEIQKREQQTKAESESSSAGGTKSQTAQGPASGGTTSTQVYKELIKSYAWDQSDKFMKLYVTMKGVQNADKSAVTSCFTKQSVTMEVKGVNGKNSELCIAHLAEPIDPDSSYHKVKTDMVLVMLKKKEEGKTWADVTELEKKVKETKKRSEPASDDPQAGLMSMLKDMYEDGDDEMKRTISKAFYESQNKPGGGMGGMGGMGGLGAMGDMSL